MVLIYSPDGTSIYGLRGEQFGGIWRFGVPGVERGVVGRRRRSMSANDIAVSIAVGLGVHVV